MQVLNTQARRFLHKLVGSTRSVINMDILQSGSIQHPQVPFLNNLKHQIPQRVWKKNHLPLSANNILDVLISTELIIKMVCVLVIWLHLRVGIS